MVGYFYLIWKDYDVIAIEGIIIQVPGVKGHFRALQELVNKNGVLPKITLVPSRGRNPALPHNRKIGLKNRCICRIHGYIQVAGGILIVIIINFI